MTPTIDLVPKQKGLQMPQIGLGTWKADPETVVNVVKESIKCGYRSLDCACDYGNETDVGKGIKEGLKETNLKRSDIFVASKLWNTYHHPDNVKPALQKTLSDLDLEYLDLFMIHFPVSIKYVPFEKRYPPGWLYDPDDEDQARVIFEDVPIQQTWKAMEALVDEGLVRYIGISNFPLLAVMELLKVARIKPSVLQVELHPYLQQPRLMKYCREHQIAITAYSPLGSRGYSGEGDAGDVLKEELIQKLADKYDKSTGQIILRWHVQRGTAAIPKTSHVKRLKENIGVFDWSLTEDEMKDIGKLDHGIRYNDPGAAADGMDLFVPIFD